MLPGSDPLQSESELDGPSILQTVVRLLYDRVCEMDLEPCAAEGATDAHSDTLPSRGQHRVGQAACGR